MSSTARVTTAGIVTIVLVAAASVLRRADLPPAVQMLILLLPAMAMVWFIVEEVRWLRRIDEFQRQVVLEALAIAFPAAMLIAIVVEALQSVGHLQNVGIGDIWPFMALTFLPALLLVNRHYNRDR